MRLIFRHVRFLNEAGIPAKVWLASTRGVSSWLEDNLEHVTTDAAGYSWLVVPETDTVGRSLPGPKLLLAQSFKLHAFSRISLRSLGFLATLTVSGPLAAQLGQVSDLPCSIIPPSVDSSVFAPAKKEKLLAYMPRRNPDGIRRVLGKALLSGFQEQALDRLSQRDVARELGRARVFLSLSLSEGFGLPALEAMASGCLVVGYSGGGGKEFLRHGENSLIAPEGDESGVIRLLGEAVERLDSRCHQDLIKNATHTAQNFSPEREQNSVVQFWKTMISKDLSLMDPLYAKGKQS